MRPIRTLMTTLMVTGLASLSYARPPAPVAAPTFSAISLGEAAGSALQQDEQKPKDTPSNPGRDEQKPKDTPASKPADAAKPVKPQQPDKAQTPKLQDQKPDKNQAKQDKKDQDKRDQAQKDQAQKDQNQRKENQDHSQDRNQANHDQNQAGGHQGSSRQVSDNDRKAHFGQEHRFSVKQVVTTTRIVPNQTRFVYTGYTFVIADPWPDDWAMDDDCYIDYVDGEYFLFDAVHPGVRIALTIVG